jgi:nucleoside-diphosphate-sugar epimerase
VTRDFIYVDDVVDAMLLAASSRCSPGVVFNLWSGIQTTIREVVDLIRARMNIPVEPQWSTMSNRDWDTKSWVGSNEALKSSLGWSPRWSLEEGLDATIRHSSRRADIMPA